MPLNLSGLAPWRLCVQNGVCFSFYVPSAIELSGTTGDDRLRMSRRLLFLDQRPTTYDFIFSRSTDKSACSIRVQKYLLSPNCLLSIFQILIIIPTVGKIVPLVFSSMRSPCLFGSPSGSAITLPLSSLLV